MPGPRDMNPLVVWRGELADDGGFAVAATQFLSDSDVVKTRQARGRASRARCWITPLPSGLPRASPV